MWKEHFVLKSEAYALYASNSHIRANMAQKLVTTNLEIISHQNNRHTQAYKRKVIQNRQDKGPHGGIFCI